MSFSAERKFSSHRLRWLIVGTIAAVVTITAANALVLAQMHQSTLRDTQEDLLRQSLTLSELVEHTFRSADLVLANVVEKARTEAAPDGDLSRLSSQDFYSFLAEKKSELPPIDTLAVLDRRGMRLTNSRRWPLETADMSTREYFAGFERESEFEIVHQPALAGFRHRNPGLDPGPPGSRQRRSLSRRRPGVDGHGLFRGHVSLDLARRGLLRDLAAPGRHYARALAGSGPSGADRAHHRSQVSDRTRIRRCPAWCAHPIRQPSSPPRTVSPIIR